ncbi:MAG: hypothetical protein OEW89_02615 [Gammaproteobacteria bacterium]|nr:hypothetical protein [Gammaproteobacteria bacterium]
MLPVFWFFIPSDEAEHRRQNQKKQSPCSSRCGRRPRASCDCADFGEKRRELCGAQQVFGKMVLGTFAETKVPRGVGTESPHMKPSR